MRNRNHLASEQLGERIYFGKKSYHATLTTTTTTAMDDSSSPPVSIHFHPKIETRVGAEALLVGRNAGAFLTWKSTETTYFITYKSAAHRGRVEHLRVTRMTGDLGWFLPESLSSQTQFNTLEDLVKSRAYLSQEADIDDVAADGGRGAPDEESALVGGLSAPSGLGLRARRGVGGTTTLPSNIAPPIERGIPLDNAEAAELDDAGIEVDESRFIRGILPIAPPEELKFWLGVTAAGGGAVAAAAGVAHYALGPRVKVTLSAASASVLKDLYAATATLYAALRTGGCDEPVGAWYAAVSEASRQGQAIVDASPEVSAYIFGLLAAFLACVAVCLALFFVHTGRKAVQLTSPETETGRTRLLEPNQWRWARAFFTVAGGASVAGYVLGHALSDGGAAARGVQHVAHTLSLRHTSAGRVAANLQPNYLKIFEAGPAAAARPSGTDDQDLLVWYFGLWGGANILAGATKECLAEVAHWVEPLVTGAPILRVALFPPMGMAPGAAVVDPLHPRCDPLAFTFLHGWLETGPLTLALLGDAQVTRAAIVLFAFLLFGGTASLFLVDAWYTSILPSLKRWRARRREAKKKATMKKALAGGSSPIKTAVHKGD